MLKPYHWGFVLFFIMGIVCGIWTATNNTSMAQAQNDDRRDTSGFGRVIIPDPRFPTEAGTLNQDFVVCQKYGLRPFRNNQAFVRIEQAGIPSDYVAEIHQILRAFENTFPEREVEYSHVEARYTTNTTGYIYGIWVTHKPSK